MAALEEDLLEAAPPPVMGDEKAAPGDPAAKDAAACPDPWLKIPTIRVFPRLGDFPVPPSGPGYYSALDFLQHHYQEKAPRFPYPPSAAMAFPFFDADFRYLDDPKNTQHDFFDPLHRCHLGCDWLFNTGGEFRLRTMNEVNSRLSGVDNNYDLLRTRVYGDLMYRDLFRFYVEFLDAQSFSQTLTIPPLAIDIDRSDFLNFFVDIKIGEVREKPVYLRVGRQELLFGSERLISPLDWANTRRTFQGARGFYAGEKFDVDLFWVQPVVPDPSNPDSVDNDRNFAGLWTTYRAQKGRFFDLYYLFLDDVTPTAAKVRLPGDTDPYNVHTLGTRYVGDKNQWLWDVELMFQAGSHGDLTTIAGAATAGGGYNFKDQPLNPTFWVYCDYASGDQKPGTGDHYTTFNQLFPFGHYYLGWLDLVGRQNIIDANAHLFLYPTKWITFWSQFHHFELADARDALYSAGGVPLRRSATGAAGHDVGNELDLILNFHLANHSDIMVGYSKLFAGDFIEKTATPGSAIATPAERAQSPELFFFMYSFRW